MAVMTIINPYVGSEKLTYDPTDAVAVTEMRKIFSELIQKNFSAYTPGGPTGTREIRDFDPTADVIVASVPVVAG